MEEDEELIKKLMSMLGNGKELKFKSPNGQTIKVCLDGNSYNETEVSIEGQNMSAEQHIENQFEQIHVKEEKDIFEPQTNLEEHQFQQCLEEISDDFNALSRIKQKNVPNETTFNEESLENMLFFNFQKLSDKENSSAKNQDHLFKQIISEIQPKIEPKQKKISLSHKSKVATNQPVIDFFKQQQQQNICPNNDIKNQIQFHPLPGSSPLIGQTKDQLILKSNSKSQTIKQNINLLKQRHPQDEKAIQMISERLYQLQEKSKIVDQSLSLINSSISNSISMKFDSFDISMLSFNQNNSQDPLCYILSQFINRAKLSQGKMGSKTVPSSFLFMYSQPLIDSKGREIQEQINYFQQEQIISKTLKQGKCKVDYIHEPATIQKLHYWIKRGIQILHFCGHGVFGGNESNYLLFQSDSGQSVKVTAQKLTQLLKQRVNDLKLVFVASCHSESAGKVFSQAGASHVICIRDQYQILDDACQQFVKLFYLTCINSKTTICEAFYFAKKQLELKGKFTKHQCQKFMIIKSHTKQSCNHYFQHRNQIQTFNDLNSHSFYNKYLLSRVEHYVPRCRDMYQILRLISKKRRYITVIGQSGIGKSTFVRQLVRYIQFRNYFNDGVVYLQLSRCQNMGKIFQVLDLELFETPQLRLNKSPAENLLRLVKQLNEKNLLIIFDNCQNIIASQDRDSFKKFTEHLMKNCKDLVFIFTNRHSIGRQIDYCSQVLYQLGKLTDSQSKILFFNKIPRNINKRQFEAFFNLDKNLKEVSEHSFFNFLNGHPEAICMTASLLADRTLIQLYQLLLKPTISKEMNNDIAQQYNPNDNINKVVSTAIRISLNVINHKYKDASQMVKILSLLPNGLDSEMMNKIFPHGGKWKQTIKKLMNHSLIQCIEKGGCKYFLLHPHIILEVENQMSIQQKIKYHQRISQQLARKIKKIYQHVGTLSQYSQRAQELFLIEEDNYKTVLLRELSFAGEKYPLRKFYQNIFKVQFEGLDEEEINDIGDSKITNTQILANYQKTKKLKTNQSEKNAQKKEAIDTFIVYYVTILFVVKKVKNTSIQTYLNYGLMIAQKKNKYLVFANLLRIKGCILLAQNNNSEAKTFFTTARAEFAQVGCGLGTACCQAAIGYIKYCQSQYASAKMNLESALKYYVEIPHPFGKHYLNRWLCSLKSKMNRQEKQLINHKLQAQKLLKEAKSNLRANNLNNISIIKHKLGFFPFRFLFDNISLFLQATFEVDLRPKFINTANQYQLSNTIFKQNKKNNFILDEINEQNVNIIPIAATSTSNMIQSAGNNLIISKTAAQVPSKKKQISKKHPTRKWQKPIKQNGKEIQKIQKVQKMDKIEHTNGY